MIIEHDIKEAQKRRKDKILAGFLLLAIADLIFISGFIWYIASALL